VPSGSHIKLTYPSDGGPPVLAVKLQELFGLADTPTVNEGRTPVLLHLLSPARRPIQVTQDLRSFWNNTYPEVRKELRGRYSKHPWPENPWKAEPTRGPKTRS
jgi:ATP-dependent helicase HrpB